MSALGSPLTFAAMAAKVRYTPVTQFTDRAQRLRLLWEQEGGTHHARSLAHHPNHGLQGHAPRLAALLRHATAG